MHKFTCATRNSAQEVSLGSLQQCTIRSSDFEGDAWTDHGVTDLDDLAVEAYLWVIQARPERVRAAESRPHECCSTPERLHLSHDLSCLRTSGAIPHVSDHWLPYESGAQKNKRE